MNTLLIILGVLSGILGGDFNAKTMPAAEQDSILAVGTQPSEGTTRYRLESQNAQKIFRRSELADWYVYDTMRNSRKRLGESIAKANGENPEVRVRDAVMSPNGRYVAFAIGNNLYIHKCDFGTEVAVSKNADPDIISGVADWLYEEEFGATALFAWSPDSKMLAFVRLDEREVPTFRWDIYGDAQYPASDSLRYPKAGCRNAKASVCVYDVATKAIQTMQVNPKEEDFYFPRLRWYNENTLFVLRLNRDQTKMEVMSCNAKSTVCHPLYMEESKKYFVDYELFDEWQWLSDGRFVVLSEKDGWRRAYLYDKQGSELKALTPEGMDVTALYAVQEKTQTLYYQAAPTPATRQLYAVSIKNPAAAVQLSEGEGMHSARFSKDAGKMIACFQSFDTPNTYTLYSVKGVKTTRMEGLKDTNAEKREAWKAYNLPEPELMQIPNGKGQMLEAMLMLPHNAQFTMHNAQLPLIVMHYSGPQSQRVLNRWRKRFEYALVEAGYAVLIVDTRGSDCKGRVWRNETYMSLGTKEAEDLIAAANYIGKRDDIDADKMALLGWSYGGYQTLYTMSMKNHPFKAGIAIAPVTDWKLYDSAYTERYMRRPQVNDRGYDEASLLNKAADLTGNVLIIHGTGDDNVHVQQTMQYIDALVRADKQFEMQLYPDDNHFLRKGNNAKHMHNKVLLFLEKNL
jgi:dipeptidyl-peptidase-4